MVGNRTFFRRVVIVLGLLLSIPALGVSESPGTSFRIARPGTPISFPQDHGSHPEYETEWWYYTGHLVPVGADLYTSAERYGFQLTFFRRARRDSPSAPAQIFLAHAALTDVASGAFIAANRLAPEELGFASAATGRLDVRHLDWSAEQVGPFHVLRFGLPSLDPTHEVRLVGREAPPLLNGERGFSKKGDCESCASLYYSIPRIEVSGHIVTPGGVRPVHGAAWMDHEYMTNALQPDQEGWDWVSLMLRDGTDLMVFRIRSKEGKPPFLAGTIRRGSETVALGADDIELAPIGDRWKSPSTGAEYPLRFRVEVPRFNIKTEIATLVRNQEVVGEGEVGISYYEGAIQTPARDGVGYLEMTGYAKPIGDSL